MRHITPFLAIFLIACPGKDDTAEEETGVVTEETETGTTDTDTETGETDTVTDTETTDDECAAELASISPANGAEGIPADALVVATFDGPVGEASIMVSGPNGAVEGSNAISSDGATVTFTPDMELERETTFTVEVANCDSSWTSSFTTVEAPIEDSALIGRTYDLDLTTVSWTSPPANIATMMMDYIDTNHLLLMVEDVDTDTQMIDLVGAAGWDNSGVVTQYPCAEAIQFDPSDFSGNPYFSAGPKDTVMTVMGAEVELQSLTFEGAFVGDGEKLDNLSVLAWLDGSFEIPNMGQLCDLVGMFGVSCESCPDGSGDCLKLDASARNLPAKENLFIDANIDPSIDPACN